MEISREALKTVLTAIREGTSSIFEATGAPAKGMNLTPGTEVSGEVLAKLPNGRYLVRVNGENLDMALPGDTQVGGSLKMTYIRDQPRLTFAISSQTVKGSEVNISSASRWLVSMSANQSDPNATENSAILRSARLFDSLPADKAFIAVRLREVVKRSGVFYESHLQQWADGDYPLEELLQEPQGQRSRLAQTDLPARTATDLTLQGKPPENPGVKTAINNTPENPDESVPNSRSASKSIPKGNTQASQLLPTETSTTPVQSQKTTDPATQKADILQQSKENQILPDARNHNVSLEKNIAPQTGKSPVLQPPAQVVPDTTSPVRTPVSHPKASEQRFQPLLTKPESTSVSISDTDPGSMTIPEQPTTGSEIQRKLAVPDEIKIPPDAPVEKIGQSKNSDVNDEPDAKPAAGEKNATVYITDETVGEKAIPLTRSTTSVDAIITPKAATSNQIITVTTADHLDPALASEIAEHPRAEQPPVQAETGKQPQQQPQSGELQTQSVRQHADIPNGKKLPIISPEPPKPDSLLKQQGDIPVQPSKLTPARFEPPDIQTLPVVRQQLEILNTGQFVWQGEAWKGQQMEWSIRRDEGQRHTPNPRKCETDLWLDLPMLGSIAAAISITGNQVRLSITASDIDSAELMKTRQNRLIEGMESCGLVLSGLEVSHDPSP